VGRGFGARWAPQKRQHCSTNLGPRGRTERGVFMLKWNDVVFDEGNLEDTARIRKQDDEFCEMLRRVIQTGRESCPLGVVTEPSTKRPFLNYVRPD
jgi:hypothetical protein